MNKSDKNERVFSAVVQWTVYVFVTLILFFAVIVVLVPLIRYILFEAPFSNSLVNIVTWSSVFLSFASLILAVSSAFLSSKDSKRSAKTLESISSIQKESANNLAEVKRLADDIVHFNHGTMDSIIKTFVVPFPKSDYKGEWSPDETK